MQQRFRRGAISIGTLICNGCDRVMQDGEVYLSIDEKPSDKFKEETIFIDDIDCSECGNKLENGEEYYRYWTAIVRNVPVCFKKKGGDSFTKRTKHM